MKRHLPFRQLVLFVAAVASAGWTGDLLAQGNVSVGGGRPMTVHVPPGYDGAVPMPLILALHGYPGSGEEMEANWGFSGLAASESFLLGLPDGTIGPCGSRFWNATDVCCRTHCGAADVDDSGYIRSLIEEAREKLNVDPRRVYLVGISAGGFMAHRAACDHADVIAGIASITGSTFLDESLCRPSRPVHVLQVHGTADVNVPYLGGVTIIGGPPIPSAADTVKYWAGYNACSLTPEEGEPRDYFSPAGNETQVLKYPACPEGGSAEFWSLAGIDHGLGGAYPEGTTRLLMAESVRWLLARPRSPIPQASFKLLPEAGEAPLTVTFDAGDSTTPEGTAILRYRWDFSDGSSAEGRTVEHTYLEPGRHGVTLTISTSDDGRSAAASASVNAWCPASSTLPWLATPLGSPRFPGAARSPAEGELELCAGGKSLGLLAGDDGLFLHQAFAGDFRLSLRVDSFTSATFGQVGAMVRLNLDPKSPVMTLLIETQAARPEGRFYARIRQAQAGVPRAVAGSTLPSPAGWMRLERQGTLIRGWSSLDGGSWEQVAEMDLPALGGPVLVGVAAAARDLGEPRFEPLAASIAGLSLGPLEPPVVEPEYRRGDANADGRDDVSDAIQVLGFLFLGDPEDLSCAKSADFNDDGEVNIADPISFLGHLFLGTPAVPAEPFGACGVDPTPDELGCETYPCS